MSIGAIVIELPVFNKKEKKKKKKKKKNMDKMGKLCFVINWYFSERFGTQLICDTYCAVNSLKVK